MSRIRNTFNAGFSLPELLVALTITLLIGASIGSALMASYDISGKVSANAKLTLDDDDFDLNFARDFASSCPTLGFTGFATGCEFWTLRPNSDGLYDICLVSYSSTPTGMLACVSSGKTESQVVYRGSNRAFRFSAAQGLPYGEWSANFTNTNHAPALISISSGTPTARIYFRRTE